MGSNREKSNIAIVILEKLQFFKGNKLFRILMVAIIFSSTVFLINYFDFRMLIKYLPQNHFITYVEEKDILK